MIANSLNNSNNSNIQNPKVIEAITIGRLAPDFIALSTQGYIRLSDYKGKWLMLTNHPFAFGAVSTTEVINLALLQPEMEKRNIQILALTTCSNTTNLSWLYDIYQKTGITVPFPIIDDTRLQVSELYGMINPDRLYGETIRNTFIINPQGFIRAILILPNTCGRSGAELLRVIDSLQITEKYNLYTPADWQLNDPLLLPSPTNFDALLERQENQANLGINCPFWYVCYVDQPVENADEPNIAPQ